MYKYATTTKYGRILLSVHDQLVVEVPEDCVAEERKCLDEAVNGAFQETLLYKIVSDESIGYSFHQLKANTINDDNVESILMKSRKVVSNAVH
jgi:DNA polymerase I-like protein with 3'-5' exonuclease and polymerase domains